MGFLLFHVLLVVLLATLAHTYSNTTEQHQNEIQRYDTTELQLLNYSCPPWRFKIEFSTSCVCGDNLYGNVKCEDDSSTVEMLTCHCMSFHDKSDFLVVGNCPYLCKNNIFTKIHSYEDISDLCNEGIQQNRQGQMCGNCLDSFSPSPYSYTFECTDCSNYKNNWFKYLCIAFLPLTIFFLVALIFRFNAMSPSLNSLILVCQILVCPAAMNLLSIYVKFTQIQSVEHDLKITVVVKFLSSVYGILNLDFFRMIYSPFCLHQNLSILQILSLDYAIAVYPLFLICVTYILIKFYNRFEIVQTLLKPARWIVTTFQMNRQWKTSNSLIETFGTFFLLSYVKIINTSFDILMPVQLYNVSGKVVGLYVYYNGSMEYFGKAHLPYAVLAIFMFVTFNLIPLLLLCLYPCRCFQSCLNCCRLNSHVLRTFMNAFQGCYKFKPYDCRYWAAFYLFLRIAVVGIFALTQTGYFVLVTGILLVPVTYMLTIVQPHKQDMYNVLDTVMILTLILVCFSAAGCPLSSLDLRYEPFTNVMFGIGVFFPILYATAQLLLYIIPNRLVVAMKKLLQHTLSKGIGALKRGRNLENPLVQDHPESDGEESENELLLTWEREPA